MHTYGALFEAANSHRESAAFLFLYPQVLYPQDQRGPQR